jgi:hypothetical protein
MPGTAMPSPKGFDYHIENFIPHDINFNFAAQNAATTISS